MLQPSSCVVLCLPHLSCQRADFSHQAQKRKYLLPCPNSAEQLHLFQIWRITGTLRNLSFFFFSSPQALSLAPIKCFQSPRKLCLLFCSNLKAKQILEVHHSYLSPVLMCPQYIVYCVCVHNTLLSLCFPKMGLKLQLSQCQASV